MATFDRMYGAIEAGAIGKGVSLIALHLRHPVEVGTLMCGLDPKLVIPIGGVAGDDPALHPECLAAWRTARKAMQPADTVKSV
jgi:hypothetical protein